MRFTAFSLAAALSLNACSEPAPPQPTAQELDAFTNKLEADAVADRNVAISQTRRAESERASAAKVRVEASATERRRLKAQ
jgi:hypothetical protein